MQFHILICVRARRTSSLPTLHFYHVLIHLLCKNRGILFRETDQPLFSQITLLTFSQPKSKQVAESLQDLIYTSNNQCSF